MSRPRVRSLLAVAGVGLAVLAIAGAPQPLDGVQRRWEDSLQPGLTDNTEVIVVAIDRASLDSFGDGWPWPRSRHAELIDTIGGAGPTAIVYDVLFTDERSDDGVLADSLAATPSVIASALTLQRRPDGQLLAIQTVRPVAELAAAASAVGHANVATSGAGVVRSLPVVVVDDREFPVASLALAGIMVAEGHSRVITERPDGVQVGDRFVPLQNGMMRVNFSDGLVPSTAISAIDLLQSRVDPAVLAGRIVVVGVTEPTLGDQHLVPTDRSRGTSGVFVVANAVNTIATDGYLSTPTSNARWWPAALLIVLVAIAVIRLPLAVGVGVGLAAVALLVVHGAWRFHGAGELHSVVGPFLAIAATTVTGTGWRYVSEVRHRRRAWNLFATYVPSDVISQLEDPATLRAAIDGARLDATVMFCDLRGFTSMSANLPANEVRSVLDHFYEATVATVHRWHGTVVKFVGDEVMAVWGAPVEDVLQGERALRCALDIQRDAPQLNARLGDLGLPGIGAGIGLHRGEVVAAHIGTHERRQYDVLGDTVNVASRLCGQAPAGHVVASPTVLADAPDDLRSALAAEEHVNLKGIDGPYRIHRWSGDEERTGASQPS